MPRLVRGKVTGTAIFFLRVLENAYTNADALIADVNPMILVGASDKASNFVFPFMTERASEFSHISALIVDNSRYREYALFLRRSHEEKAQTCVNGIYRSLSQVAPAHHSKNSWNKQNYEPPKSDDSCNDGVLLPNC